MCFNFCIYAHSRPYSYIRSAENNFDIPQIVDFRSSLINSRFKADVRDVNKLIEISQEIGMASRPVDVEINLEQKPKFRMNSDSQLAPMGPNAKLKKAELAENPHIDTRVDKVVSDTDLKAKDALVYLYEHNFDENFLSKLLSVGTVGLKDNRKIVPTRWSISAVDDLVGKHLYEQITQYEPSNYQAYFGSYLGNYYLIMFFPEIWSYELFETYMPKASWNVGNKIEYMTDYEPYQGRKEYAENTAGGYYASRVAILEKLNKLKKQSSVFCLRFITGEYAVPLGVWVCRESVRKALSNKPIEFASKELMLNYAQILIKRKFNFDLEKILKNSILLKNINQQSKLTKFL